MSPFCARCQLWILSYLLSHSAVNGHWSRYRIVTILHLNCARALVATHHCIISIFHQVALFSWTPGARPPAIHSSCSVASHSTENFGYILAPPFSYVSQQPQQWLCGHSKLAREYGINDRGSFPSPVHVALLSRKWKSQALIFPNMNGTVGATGNNFDKECDVASFACGDGPSGLENGMFFGSNSIDTSVSPFCALDWDS